MLYRLTSLIFANAVATLLTNPFDVVLSKIATQQPIHPASNKLKYSGFINCMRSVYKEEGWRKLALGGIHPRFMFNMFNGFLFLFVYD